MLTGSLSRLGQKWRSFVATLTASGTVAGVKGSGPKTWSGAGTLSSSGVLARIAQRWRSLVATLTTSGTVTRVKQKPWSGSGVLTSSGALTRIAQRWRSFSGSLTFTGNIDNGRSGGVPAGSITPSGIVRRILKIGRTLTGTLSPVGDLTAFKKLTPGRGILSFAGTALSRVGGVLITSYSAVGVLTCAGVVSYLKRKASSFQGVVSFAGFVVGRKTGVAMNYAYSASGNLNISGGSFKNLYFAKAGVLTFSGVALGEKCIEILYYGVANP
jgi:hypothetical protein